MPQSISSSPPSALLLGSGPVLSPWTHAQRHLPCSLHSPTRARKTKGTISKCRCLDPTPRSSEEEHRHCNVPKHTGVRGPLVVVIHWSMPLPACCQSHSKWSILFLGRDYWEAAESLEQGLVSNHQLQDSLTAPGSSSTKWEWQRVKGEKDIASSAVCLLGALTPTIALRP